MRVLSATLGSHGDVHPFLALGRALVERGHEFALLAHPYFAPAIERAGLRAVPIPARLAHEDIVRRRDLFHHLRGAAAVGRMMDEAFDDLAAETRREIARHRPDVVVTHHVAAPAQWIARAAGIPAANVGLAPMMWFGRADPVPSLQFRDGVAAHVAARAAMPFAPWIMSVMTDRWLNRVRARLGFRSQRGVLWRSFREAPLNLGLWSPAFRGPLADDPPGARICGFAWYDGAGEEGLDPAIEEFLAAGAAPVVFTLGSAAVHHAGDYHALAARACAALGVRGLILAGDLDYVPRDLPRGVRAFAWAPHSRLLPRGRATVHHGGIGTTAQALRAGRPAVVTAFAHDQFNNGLRAARLGAAVMTPRHTLDDRRLTRALRRVLETPSYATRAMALGAALAAEDGAMVAAQAIETFAAEIQITS